MKEGERRKEEQRGGGDESWREKNRKKNGEQVREEREHKTYLSLFLWFNKHGCSKRSGRKRETVSLIFYKSPR